MLPVKPLAIGLMTVAAVFPASSAFAQVKVNIGIGINTDPYPQRPAVYYPPQPRATERVIVVERNTQTVYSDDRSYRWEHRGRREGWKKHGWRKHKHYDRDDD